MQTSRHPHQGDQVENFSSYQTHAKSPPSYQQCMMMMTPPGAQIVEEEDNFSNHSPKKFPIVGELQLMYLELT